MKVESDKAANPRYLSAPSVLLAALVLPPAGLVLLWLRNGPAIFRKILLSLGIAAFGVVHLFAFYGMRIISDGSGFPSIITFSRPGAHDVELERHRAEQQRELQQPQPAGGSAALDTVPGEASTAPKTGVKEAVVRSDTTPAGSAYWTGFRGPNRDGRYDQMRVLTRWPGTGLRPVWKQPVGGGYASFAVARGRAFTIEQRRDREFVAAYDLATGRELWTHSWEAKFQESMGGDGPRATPTWHDGRVYALGATGEFRCLDERNGKALWSRNILKDAGAGNLEWGMAVSPLVVDDKVIVLPGGGEGKSVAAYDLLSGEIVWTALNDKGSYTSPMLATLAGRRQILLVTASRVLGIGVEGGAPLWEFPWVTQYDTNSAQPILAGENRFVISAGYGHGAALIEVTPSGDSFQARAIWQNAYLKTRFNGAVLYEKQLYGLDEGILVCLDLETGERRWKGGRYGYGQLLLASGHLWILSEDGDLVLVKASPERHEEISRMAVLSGKTWNNPALSDGYLLVRNANEMAAFKIGAAE